MRDALRAQRTRAQKLAAVLRRHHEWHLANTDPDEHGIVEAEAYAESLLCDETIDALRGTNPTT